MGKIVKRMWYRAAGREPLLRFMKQI